MDINIADIVIHIHPELPDDQRGGLESAVGAMDGVVSVHFSHGHHHALTIAYNPKAIASETILDEVRRWDPEAVMAGL
jgi:hypothetical protein